MWIGIQSYIRTIFKIKSKDNITFQEFDMDPQQARVSHPPIENNEHLEKAYVVEVSESAHT